MTREQYDDREGLRSRIAWLEAELASTKEELAKLRAVLQSEVQDQDVNFKQRIIKKGGPSGVV